MQVCYIISDIDKALAFEWIASALQKTLDIRFILLNNKDSALERFLIQEEIPVIRITCQGKRDWPVVWWRLVCQLRIWKPQVIHCHLLQASILGLSAALVAGIGRRIVTRHHGDLHHRYHKKGIFWDWICSLLATDVVAISKNVRKILLQKEHVAAEKIHLIPHGFSWPAFRNADSIKSQRLRHKYALVEMAPVVGCIARFTELKGIQYLIPAFRDFLKSYPDALLVLANAHGDYEKNIHELLGMLPSKNYRLISFEKALGELYQCFDLFVHVPVDKEVEAFGQTYVEALAAEVPSIFTLSGIAPDFIKDGHNAWVVPYRDSNAILSALLGLWRDPIMRSRLRNNGWDSVKEEFSISRMILSLEELYGR